jgi:hypothetical protein
VWKSLILKGISITHLLVSFLKCLGCGKRIIYLSLHVLVLVLERKSKIVLILLGIIFITASCTEPKKEEVKEKSRVFSGYHILLDEIIRSKEGVFRGIDLNTKSDLIKTIEPSPALESSAKHLYFEYKADSLTNYSIEYTLNKDSLEEINLQINTDDLELSSYLFCDLKDYYANKLPNPTEDKGYVVYNCFEGQRKPFVVSLSDNSSPTKGIINMVIYKDK